MLYILYTEWYILKDHKKKKKKKMHMKFMHNSCMEHGALCLKRHDLPIFVVSYGKVFSLSWFLIAMHLPNACQQKWQLWFLKYRFQVCCD